MMETTHKEWERVREREGKSEREGERRLFANIFLKVARGVH